MRFSDFVQLDASIYRLQCDTAGVCAVSDESRYS